MSDLCTRDELLSPVVKRRYREFPVQLNNGVTKTARIRSLTERERSKFELSGLDERGRWRPDRARIMKCKLIALCCVDSNGDLIFSDDDVNQLMDQDASTTGMIYDECCSHVGLDNTSGEAATEKNCDAGATTERCAG